MRTKISSILLGAGESRRMGMDKLSLPWGKETVFEHCFKTLLQSNIGELVVVLSHKNKKLNDRFQGNKVKVVVNPHPEKGMSASIRKGLQAIDPKSQGILIALGDQPLLKTRTINALINSFSPKKGDILLPSYNGMRGNPVLFDRCYRKELESLKGDVGGRPILERYSKNVRVFRTKSKGVVLDIDTWNDYKNIKNGFEKRVMSLEKGA
jgi:molybdenum cofactor cytidylyltransferase